MLKFNEFLKEIQESLINLGNTRYPKSDNILLLAGGAGSGKGFILNSLLGFEGKTFDVDELKKKMIRLSSKGKSPEFAKKIKEKLGISVDKLDLKNPKHVSALHAAIEEMGLSKKEQAAFIEANKNSKNKPNMIFDVTLKNTKKFNEIMKVADEMNYPKENRHIVWILNKIEIAMEQNAERERSVPENILVQTHEGASFTMKHLIENSENYRKYADGDIIIVFNAKDVDVKVDKNSIENKTPVIEKGYNSIKIKYAGRPINKEMVNKQLFDSINDYVPKSSKW